MKKIIILILMFSTIYILTENKKVIIPEDAIRFRVVANSNKTEDQNIKIKVKNNLTNAIKDDLNNINNINDVRNILNSNINKYKSNVLKTLDDNNTFENVKINYGYNYFPEKEYKDVKYKEGEYESLVVTLGDGLGDNFWCVLFPPLCMVDEDKPEKEYKIFIKEIIDKIF